LISLSPHGNHNCIASQPPPHLPPPPRPTCLCHHKATRSTGNVLGLLGPLPFLSHACILVASPSMPSPHPPSPPLCLQATTWWIFLAPLSSLPSSGPCSLSLPSSGPCSLSLPSSGPCSLSLPSSGPCSLSLSSPVRCSFASLLLRFTAPTLTFGDLSHPNEVWLLEYGMEDCSAVLLSRTLPFSFLPPLCTYPFISLSSHHRRRS
ncbi:unnamed protein product, partial [Closterium sp. Naga37s-1]